MQQFEFDASHMARALELAAGGQGLVEPNPMVGCVIVRDGETVGEGFHRRFGGQHAEIEALAVAGPRAAGADAYVTLEPCCHHGKTPPCTEALAAAGVRRVLVALGDPFAQVAGQGIAELERAGIEVEVGLLENQARELVAPYLKLVTKSRPWIIAKWAMTLDGKLATRGGGSRWISCWQSRQIAHQLRGRVDAVMVGRNTAAADDPLLTARPPGPRTATRIVLDSAASLSSDSQLVRTARDVPVIVAAAEQAPAAQQQRLTSAGCEVLVCPGATPDERLGWLLDELGRRQMTNVLVEGGSQLLGSLLDLREIDEIHVILDEIILGLVC
jgi:diaminohydroxyphosphoribosylaminopyrimidine deaminase/5-amino-6-(5-phosphoribosylamino)uracil reductase